MFSMQLIAINERFDDDDDDVGDDDDDDDDVCDDYYYNMMIMMMIGMVIIQLITYKTPAIFLFSGLTMRSRLCTIYLS